MKVLNYIIIISMLFTAVESKAQNWKNLRDQAIQFELEGDIFNAANSYQQAWEKKPQKIKLFQKAGSLYVLTGAYLEASNLYVQLANANNMDFKPGLEYAHCLKALGQYEKAKEAYSLFLDNYNELDKFVLADVVLKQKEGCDWAIAEKPSAKNIGWLPNVINTKENQKNPSYANNHLYFSSQTEGKYRFVVSQNDAKWNTVEQPKGMGFLSNFSIESSCFSLDGNQFFFTVCEEDCQIFYSNNLNGVWSEPTVLPPTINRPQTSNITPSFYTLNDKEYLLFSSDRNDGQGGFDIYWSSKEVRAPVDDWSRPINLGPKINTFLDEISPFYNPSENNLYFSSKGHRTIGGYDIFVTNGNVRSWNTAQNMGWGINSSFDDIDYFENDHLAFFSSNRKIGTKTRSTYYDIFKFEKHTDELKLLGKIIDSRFNEQLNNVHISLFEKLSNGKLIPIAEKHFENGRFEIPLIPEKELVVRASKIGYHMKEHSFSTKDINGRQLKDFILEKITDSQELITASLDNENPILEDRTTDSIPVKAPYYTENKTSLEPKIEIPDDYQDERIINTNDQIQGTTTFGKPIEIEVEETNELAQPESIPNEETRIEYTNKLERTMPMEYSGVRYSDQHFEGIPVFNPVATLYESTDEPYTTQSKNRLEKFEYKTNQPRYKGVYYKVQLVSLTKVNLQSKLFIPLEKLGRFDTEYIPSKGITRVLLADFLTFEDAYRVSQFARKVGFNRTFVVKYEDGFRLGQNFGKRK